MRGLTGQAARVLHALLQFAVALVLTLALGVTALTWRLSRGPLELPWLAQHVAAAVDAETPGHLSLASAALAWQGFRAGFNQPLAIRLTGLVVADDAGRRLASVPRAQVALSVGWLVLGRLVPRSIELDGARLRVMRAADGTVTLDLGGLGDAAEPGGASGDGGDLLRELARPAAPDRARGRASRWSQLEHVRIDDAAITVDDRQFAMTWAVPTLTVDLRRRPQGGVFGQAEARLALGGQTADLTASAELRGDHTTHVAARLSPLVPATLAALTPAAAALAAVDAPVGVSATVDLDAELRPTHIAGFLDAGAGTLHAGTGTMPLREAHVEAAGTLAALHVALTRLVTSPRADGPRTTIQAQADIARAGDGVMQVTGALDLDQVAFADLAAVWPEGTGGNGTRPWVTRSLTGGIARNGHVEMTLGVSADVSDVTVSRIDGRVEGHDVTLHWLPPVPPIEHAEARLTIHSPDALAVDVTTGRQAGGALVLQGGRASVTGLDEKDQFVDIGAELTGPVADLLGLLKHPRIKLLDRSPLPVRDAAGQLAGHVTVTRLPLRDNLSFDAVHIRTEAHVTGLRLAGIAAGHDLDRGALDVQASPDGLHAAGTAELAGIPAQLALDMDFRVGPAAQVTQKVAVSGTLDAKMFVDLGVAVGDRLTGTVQLSAELQTRRDRQGSVEVHADLAHAAIRLDPTGYTKPAGQPARLDARLVLDGDRIAAIERVAAQGPGLRIDAAADMAGGTASVLRVQHLVLGTGTDLHGTLRLPSAQGGAYAVSVTGASLDASALLRRPDRDPEPAASGPAWSVDATLDRVIVGPGRVARAVTLRADSDGTVLRRAALAGRTADGTPFQLAVEPQPGGRRLTAGTQDAGGLLRLFNVLDSMQGGRLSVTGSYDDTRADHPLSGTATIEAFRIRNAPALARLLQAMTLYGVLELAQGPGLGFTRLVAPFRYAGDTLSLLDARAYSASLGMTAKGSVQLDRRQVDMTGTIVPAYFFNTLLGRIPLVGRLFSPEPGGGVFSATYAVRGPLDGPDVSINPLAALTPGALRGLFNLFDRETVAK